MKRFGDDEWEDNDLFYGTMAESTGDAEEWASTVHEDLRDVEKTDENLKNMVRGRFGWMDTT